MKAPQLYTVPTDEPFTSTSSRWMNGVDDIKNPNNLKGYDNWIWERIQEAAAIRYSTHNARVEALYRAVQEIVSSTTN